MRRATRTCLVLLLCTWDSLAHAQAMDLAGARILQHRPFELALLVRGDTLPASRAAHCIEGSFDVGSQHLPADEVQLTYAASERPGWYRVVFRHPHVVDTSALVARLVLRCPALYERELVLPTQPADRDPQPPATTQTFATPVPAATPTRQAAATNPRLNTKPPTPTRAVPAPTNSALATHTPETTGALLREEGASRLQDEVSRLRKELALERNKVLQLQPRADHKPSLAAILPQSTWQQAAWLGLAVPLLALLPWWRRHRAKAGLRIRLMEITLPREPVPTQTTPAPIAPSAPKPAPTPAPAREPPTAAPVPWVPPTAQALPVQTPFLDEGLIPPTAPAPGAASLEDRDAAIFTRQVEDLVSDGYIGVAVELLERSLHAGVAKNPWLLLQLLGLHQRLGHLVEVAQTISLLQTLYRVHLPTASGQILAGKDLLSQAPQLLDTLSACWESPKATAILEDWVFRVPGPAWDLATFEDLLLLHAVAQNRAQADASSSLPSQPARFEPVLEWSTEET